MKGPVARGACTLRSHALTRTQTLLTGRRQNARLRFKLPGFYSSKRQNSTSCHKQVDASDEREGASGLKNERSNSETSFDKSCSSLTLLSAPQGHIRGARVTVTGLILFRGAVNSTFCFLLKSTSFFVTPVVQKSNFVDLRFESGVFSLMVNTRGLFSERKHARLFWLSSCGLSERTMSF